MRRVATTSDPSLNLFGTGKHGYTDGSAGVTASTVITSGEFLNPVQEEIATAIERSGIQFSSSNTDHNQLFKAIFLRSARSSLMNCAARTPSMGGAMTAIAGRIPTVGQVPLMVLVGASGSIGTSIDGTTWTAHTAAGGYSGQFNGAYVDQDGAVIVGANGEIQTSPTGATWTHRATGGGFSGSLYAVTRSGTTGYYVAVGANGEIQISTDGGVTWSHQTADFAYSGQFRGAAYSAEFDRFIIVGADGEIQTSPNATTWTRRISGAGTGVFLYSVACPPFVAGGASYASGPIVVVGNVSGTPTEDMLYYSTDGGATWNFGTRPGSRSVTENQMVSVSAGYVPGEDGVAMAYYVAVGLSGRTLVSANGRNWMDATRNIFGAIQWNAVCCEPGSGTVISCGPATALIQSPVI